MKTSGKNLHSGNIKKQLDILSEHWLYISPLASPPQDDHDLERLIDMMDELLDAIGENESHPLMGLIDLISYHIETYETSNITSTYGHGIDAIKFLMKTHHLKQSDLPEIGSQGVVSEILNGKRQLNRRQIVLLAKRFGVSIDTFI